MRAARVRSGNRGRIFTPTTATPMGTGIKKKKKHASPTHSSEQSPEHNANRPSKSTPAGAINYTCTYIHPTATGKKKKKNSSQPASQPVHITPRSPLDPALDLNAGSSHLRAELLVEHDSEPIVRLQRVRGQYPLVRMRHVRLDTLLWVGGVVGMERERGGGGCGGVGDRHD